MNTPEHEEFDDPVTAFEHLQYWFGSVASAEIILSDDPQVEANENLWWISLSQEMASDLSPSQVADCVADYIETKRREAKRRRLPPLLFYLWFDELSARLCFSLSLIADPAYLDFQCEINAEAELLPIVSNWLSSPYLNGVPWDELSAEISGSEPATADAKLLDVYVTRI